MSEKIRTALVLGLGASGRAAVDWLEARGHRVVAADTRTAPAGLEAFCAAHPAVSVKTGGLPASLLEGVSLLVVSPGLSIETGPAAEVVHRARSEGVEVIGEIECFARELARLKVETGYAPKVIGITGTNGKTTTTTLTTRMLCAAGLKAVAAGNIGPNAVTELLKAEASGTLPDVWVLELSSFQLATTANLVCDAAALLNVTEDHIDWHGSLAAYADAKRRIFSTHTHRVLNREDAESMKSAVEGRTSTFGASEPTRVGEFGLAQKEGALHLARRRADGALELFMPEAELLIAGRHNAMNALAALALVDAIGVDLETPLEALASYKGEPHRVELILSAGGVDFIDDSKGTNVGAVIAAAEGFAAQGRGILILLGGDGKGQDFKPLAKALAGRARLAALIGRDAGLIAEALEREGVPFVRKATLEAAVEALWREARPGDAVLLSPACASWDMFRDYAERSARFRDAALAVTAAVHSGASS